MTKPTYNVTVAPGRRNQPTPTPIEEDMNEEETNDEEENDANPDNEEDINMEHNQTNQETTPPQCQ